MKRDAKAGQYKIVRRVVSCTLGAVLGAAVLALPVGATSGRVMTGTTTCSVASTLSFSPALKSSTSGGDTVGWVGKLTNCSVSVTGQPRIKYGFISIHSSAGAGSNSCDAVLGSGTPLPNLHGFIKWYSTVPIAQSKASVSGASFFDNVSANLLELTVPSGDSSSATGGSFPGPITFPTMAAVTVASKLLGMCRAGVSSIAIRSFRLTVG